MCADLCGTENLNPANWPKLATPVRIKCVKFFVKPCLTQTMLRTRTASAPTARSASPSPVAWRWLSVRRHTSPPESWAPRWESATSRCPVSTLRASSSGGRGGSRPRATTQPTSAGWGCVATAISAGRTWRVGEAQMERAYTLIYPPPPLPWQPSWSMLWRLYINLRRVSRKLPDKKMSFFLFSPMAVSKPP